MTSMKKVFGAFVFLFLAAALFATPDQPTGGLLGEPAGAVTSITTIVPVDAMGCVDPAKECWLTATVFAFDPPPNVPDADKKAFAKACEDDVTKGIYDSINTCMLAKSAEYLRTHPNDAKPVVIPVPNAKLVFMYSNIVTDTLTTVENCGAVIADIKTQVTLPNTCDPAVPGCEPIKVDSYSGKCKIPDSIRQGHPTTKITVIFEGTKLQPPLVQKADTEVLLSENTFIIRNPQSTAATALTRQLGDLIAGLAEAQGYSGGTTLPCVGVFLILGLLLASLYFAGKSPISLLDITTPKLPAPKGVAAGGQVLLPYGWSEMKGTTKAKMASGVKAISTNLGALGLAKGATADETVRNAITNLGQKVGKSSAELEMLRKQLPYKYGDAEHKLVAEIFDKASGLGPREKLMAMQAKDYLMGDRTMKSLEAITGHKGIGVKSPLMTRIDTVMRVSGMNANRYAVLGGGATAGMASLVRTGQIMKRGAKEMAGGIPSTALKVTQTTMEMMGNKRGAEQLERKFSSSPAMKWFSNNVATRPQDLEVGTHYPITGKMGALYKSLHEETLHDEMRYVLKQLYKKAGMKFNLDERELMEMGYKDMDILKRCGYAASAETVAFDAAVRKILSDHSLNSQQKLSQLVAFAESHGAYIDHRVTSIATELAHISGLAQPEYLKLGMVQQVLERENTMHMAVAGGRHADDAYVCHVGRDARLRGSEMFETMVLRTMTWDAEHGYLSGGIREELVSARLNIVNRVTGLDASSASAIAQLPEHMRNQAELEKLAARNKTDLMSLFSEEGRSQFQQVKGKSINSASVSEIVSFMYGGSMPASKTIDKQTGKMVWWGEDQEHGLNPNATLVDVKRHWITGLEPRENFAIGQWVESRFTKSYVPHFDAEIEAQLNRTHGSASWTVEQRTQEAKKLLLNKLLGEDMENRFNSQFAQNAYGGTTHETLRFYQGTMAGVLKTVMQNQGLESNHPDLVALENINVTDPKSIGRFNALMTKYRSEIEAQLQKPITYDDVVKSKQAIVMLHEGGLAYYHKGMMLSDMDRVLGGEVALKDNKGQLRKYVPDDVSINFGNNANLMSEFARVRGSKTAGDWTSFIENAKVWAKEGGYNYDREKVFAAVLWQYGNTTYDYARFWHESAVTVESKRIVTPVAPSPLRFFGIEAPGLNTMLKPFRDMGLHLGDYVSKVSLAAGGPVHKAAYDIAPISEYYRQHSFQLASKIMSGEALKGLTADERVAYRAAAMDHAAYHQVWDYAIDRNPWRTSTSFGAHQSWSSFFHFGPAAVFSVKENLGASMSRGQYANIMTFYGFPMDLAGKIMRPYSSMIKGMQMSMQGYASKWDATGDSLKQWNYTQPRLLEAMQSVNPFSFKWFPGKTSERLQKLNVYGGSLEKHQLAGSDFLLGLRQAPQDISLTRKGVYASARTGEANPGVSHYNYRHELMPEAAVGEYLLRQKEGAFMHDERVRESAMTNTVRRTVSAEALAMRRNQELRSFGVMQNPLYGFASPIAALWHMPIPGAEALHLAPKDWVSSAVNKAKTGGRSMSFSERIESMAVGIGRGLTKLTQPGQLSRVVYCPRCGMSNMRGSSCKNASCRQAQY
jgi:hypothetical protein